MSSWPWPTAWAWLVVLINQVLKNQDFSVYFFILMPINSFSRERFCTLPYFETGGIVACSRLSDSGEAWKSGEDTKVKGVQKRGVGQEKRKKEGKETQFPLDFFKFGLSQFCGPDYLRAWNRLGVLEERDGLFRNIFFILQVWGYWQLVEISTLNWWILVDHQRYELI